MDGDPADFSPGDFNLSDVQPGADIDPELSSLLGDRTRAPHRLRWYVEDGERPISGGVYLLAAEPFQLTLRISW